MSPAAISLAERRAAAKRIAREAMEGDAGDPLDALGPLDKQFFGGQRVALHIPLTRGSYMTRKCLLELVDGLQQLVFEMDQIPAERSKLLHAQTTIRRWNHAFLRRMRADTPATKEPAKG